MFNQRPTTPVNQIRLRPNLNQKQIYHDAKRAPVSTQAVPYAPPSPIAMAPTFPQPNQSQARAPRKP